MSKAKTAERHPSDDDEPLSALAFKLMMTLQPADFIRVYSGTLKKGDAVEPGEGWKERIGRIVLTAGQRPSSWTNCTPGYRPASV